MTRWFAGAVAAIVVAAAGAARAQSPTGAIEGVVVDQTGGALPGVVVAVRQPATGSERSLVTDDRGGFQARLLPVGVYDITASLPGFRFFRHAGLRLAVGQALELRLELTVADVATAVTVSGAPPLVETGRSGVASAVDETAVQSLPVNGRNFLDFVLLTPGMTRDVRQGDLSFAGQRGPLNSLIVDGVDNNNTFVGQTFGRTGSGRAPYQFSADAVREFQVNASAYPAEYGRAGGGVINVVTKSGTNDSSGSLFEFYRDIALNATNVVNELNHQPKSPYHYHQFGGTLGGPLRANRDFYFLNYDGQRNRQSNLVFLNLPPNTPSDPATLAGIARLEPYAYSWDRSLNQDVFLLKTDHQLNWAHRLSIRYNHQDFTGEGYENGGPQNAFEHTGASLVNTRTLNANWAGVFGNRLFNELRIQYARDDEPGDANSGNPEAIVQQSGAVVLVIGRNNFSPRANTIDRVQVANTLTAVHGSHKVKAGFDLQFDRIRNYFPGFFSGQYVFRSLASFGRGRPDGPNETYLQNFPGPGTSGAETNPDLAEYSVFVQDEWRLRPTLTVNAGLRYDLSVMSPPPVRNPDPQLAAAGINTSRFSPDTDNLGPRLGVAWSPGDRRFVLRAGWGLHYGRVLASMLSAAAGNNGVNVISLTFTGPDVPAYPQKFTDIPAGGTAVRPNIFYIDNRFASSRVTQANGAIEWALGRDTSLSATYLLADGRDLTRSIDRNLGTLGERTLTIAGTGEAATYHVFGNDRPFTNFQRVVAYESSAESRYHGVTLDLNRRFSGHTQFRVAYTLGRVVDTVPDATAIAPGNAGDDGKFASNPANFDVDRTVGNNDQPHRLVASGVFGARGWWLSGILTAQSGQPYSARVNGDLNNDGNARNDLAPGTRRNGLRLPAIATIDARIARDIPIAGRTRAQLIVETFNLLNRDNINGVVPGQYGLAGATLTPNGSFGRPTSSAGERILQLAARVTF